MSPATRLRKIPEATRNDERFEAKRLATAVPEPLTNGLCGGNSWFGDIHYKSSTAGSQPRLWRDVRWAGQVLVAGLSLWVLVLARTDSHWLKHVLLGPELRGRTVPRIRA